ncbi:DUF7429 family protein [Mycobacterium sp. Root265]|uniref:DUF7429 family protein n=1 Tax=Mycobacterium sp. Root265 TaxID=1736504 RepID=UPI000AE6DDDD|nr:hypothetical protein [Mycobacterium sp. Root265]
MKLTLNLFGYEVATVELQDRTPVSSIGAPAPRPSLLDIGIKKVSGFWVDRMRS